MDYTILKADLAVKAPGIIDPIKAAAIINGQPPKLVPQPIPMPIVLTWAAKNGVLTKLQARASNNVDSLQNAAIAFLLTIQGGYPLLDLSDPDIKALFTAFQQTGDFTTDAGAALQAKGIINVPYTVATYGVPYISADDVKTALGLK